MSAKIRQDSASSRQPSAVKWWAALGLLTIWFFALGAAKNLPWILYVLSVFAFAYQGAPPLRKLASVALVGIILAALALLAPFDVCFRQRDSFRIAVLPVIHEAGSGVLKREVEERGRVVNKDFVVYDRFSAFTQVRWALTIFYP
jgi:hypothetical protein